MNKHQPEPMKATEAKRIVLDILYRPISCVGIGPATAKTVVNSEHKRRQLNANRR